MISIKGAKVVLFFGIEINSWKIFKSFLVLAFRDFFLIGFVNSRKSTFFAPRFWKLIRKNSKNGTYMRYYWQKDDGWA